MVCLAAHRSSNGGSVHYRVVKLFLVDGAMRYDVRFGP